MKVPGHLAKTLARSAPIAWTRESGAPWTMQALDTARTIGTSVVPEIRRRSRAAERGG